MGQGCGYIARGSGLCGMAPWVRRDEVAEEVAAKQDAAVGEGGSAYSAAVEEEAEGAADGMQKRK